MSKYYHYPEKNSETIGNVFYKLVKFYPNGKYILVDGECFMSLTSDSFEKYLSAKDFKEKEKKNFNLISKGYRVFAEGDIVYIRMGIDFDYITSLEQKVPAGTIINFFKAGQEGMTIQTEDGHIFRVIYYPDVDELFWQDLVNFRIYKPDDCFDNFQCYTTDINHDYDDEKDSEYDWGEFCCGVKVLEN